MTVDPNREAQVNEAVQRDFADLEQSFQPDDAQRDALRVYGCVEASVRQAEEFLTLLVPVAATFSTSNSSNSEL